MNSDRIANWVLNVLLLAICIPAVAGSALAMYAAVQSYRRERAGPSAPCKCAICPCVKESCP